jgi:uncharacterized protein YndB with AHSA1/START domain
MRVDSDRRFSFDAERDTVWRALCTVEDYPRWWPWLRSFEAHGMMPGDVWLCVVQPPLPYRLRFTVAIDEVVDAELVTATVDGDLVGTARLELADAATGSEVRLASHLTPTNRVARRVAAVAAPVARFGHDWVLRTGVRQFAAGAL